MQKYFIFEFCSVILHFYFYSLIFIFYSAATQYLLAFIKHDGLPWGDCPLGLGKANIADCFAEAVLNSVRFFAEFTLSEIPAFAGMTRGEGLRMTRRG
jgi:hypothetical protein